MGKIVRYPSWKQWWSAVAVSVVILAIVFFVTVVVD